MIIYRTVKRRCGMEHDGYVYHLSKQEANRAHKEQAHKGVDTIETFEVSMNKHDLIQFLNDRCSYPDNG